MASYTWRNVSGGSGGAFDTASNWSNPSESVSTSVPAAGDTATFGIGGGPISGTGSVDTIAFTATAWSILGQLTANTVTVNGATLTAASSGGQLVVNGVLNAGLSAAATLVVTNSGSIAVTGSASGPISQFGNATVTVSNRGIASFGSGLSLGAGGSTNTAVTTAVLTVGGVLRLGASGSGVLSVGSGGEVIVSAATDTTQPYLQLGAGGGSTGTLNVDGSSSILLLANNSGAVGYRGTGTLSVTGGASARFNASANASNNALNPALTIGFSGIGKVTVSGTNSLLAAGGTIVVGTTGSGTLSVQSGGSVTSMAFAAGQSALSVGAAAGGTGSVTIDGSGSSLVTTGAVVVGGDNRGSGLTLGGTGSIVVTNGGTLQIQTDPNSNSVAGDLTVLGGSSLGVGGGSQATIAGSLVVGGNVASAGVLVVSGAVYGGGTVTMTGGVADFGTLGANGAAAAQLAFASSSATVRLHGLTGAGSVSGMQAGDEIDLLGNTSVRLSGTTVTTTTGSLNLSAAPNGGHYVLASDGAGGTLVEVASLTTDTIGVFRFFDSNYGTHFFSASASERDSILATRPDLVYEGVGLQAVNPSVVDPNATPVYRFFDTTYGTHFFTASTSERDTVIATRPDLSFEGTGFIEHATQQAGDVAVYRFFDSRYGTHFYTADANEKASIVATRPDLILEGTGFYAPTS